MLYSCDKIILKGNKKLVNLVLRMMFTSREDRQGQELRKHVVRWNYC